MPATMTAPAARPARTPRRPWVDPTTVRYDPASLADVGRNPGEHFRKFDAYKGGDNGPRAWVETDRPAADPVTNYPRQLDGDDALVFLARPRLADGTSGPSLAEQRVAYLFPDRPGLFSELYLKVMGAVEHAAKRGTRGNPSADVRDVHSLGERAFGEALTAFVGGVIRFDPDAVGPAGRAGDSPDALGRFVWLAVFGQNGRLRTASKTADAQFHAGTQSYDPAVLAARTPSNQLQARAADDAGPGRGRSGNGNVGGRVWEYTRADELGDELAAA